MKHHFTPSASKDDTSQLVYSPENDEFLGIEKFSDIFEFLEKNTFQVDEQIMGEIINFAEKYSSTGQ
jgi:hypothetical protein